MRDDDGYRIRPADQFSPGLAMDTEMLLEFLENTQADTMSNLRAIYKERTEETVINYINAEINKPSRGLIDVIKHGVEFDSGYELKLMYRKPDSTKNPVAVDNYNRNIFSVMEEVYHKSDERIDLVLFLNGIAIFAVELKCNTSGQNYEDAIKQCKYERDCTTRLLKEKVGVFAAFAMDLNEVYFCTKLLGKDSFFNPFNMGFEFGKGNPHNDQSGINVSYMWEDIWTKDKILFLIERFIYIKTKERKNSDTGKVRRTKELIFPRFHQLRAVEKVMNDVILNHSSCNYLIEHSAGSGKTETISWLAHILSTVHDADNNNVFDTVLVITDRIVVDRQLQEAIMGMEHKSGQVNVFYHPMNKGGRGAQRLFEGNIGLIYPDFISRDNENRIIADAKYKPIDNIGNRDYLQVLAYMFRFDAKAGYYLYPETEGADDLRLRMNQGSTYEKNVSPREDISVTKHGLIIPRDVQGYSEFIAKIKVHEQDFRAAFAEKQTV